MRSEGKGKKKYQCPLLPKCSLGGWKTPEVRDGRTKNSNVAGGGAGGVRAIHSHLLQ